MDNFMQEAFTSLNCLTEETFKTDKESLEELDNFIDEEPDETIDVIDIEAETDEELKDSYIGDVILGCPVCGSKIFKAADRVFISPDDKELCNVDEECPYCYTTNGFRILGEVAPFEETEVDVKDKDKDEKDDDKSDKKETKSDNENDDVDLDDFDLDEDDLTESFDNAKIEVDNTEISIKSKEQPGEEMLAPLSSELESQIEDNSLNAEVESEENADEENPDEFEDVDIDDFDEESFEEVAESYIKSKYSDVRSCKVKNVSEAKNKLVVESVIKFNNGEKRNTKFTLTPNYINKKNVSFLAENYNMRAKFQLNGRLGRNNRFITRTITK